MKEKIISRDDVEYVAQLARLGLNEEEKDLMADNLESILEYVEKLNELDTEKVEPMTHSINVTNVSRPDEVGKGVDRESIMKIAPDQDTGYYIVPKIIE